MFVTNLSSFSLKVQIQTRVPYDVQNKGLSSTNKTCSFGTGTSVFYIIHEHYKGQKFKQIKFNEVDKGIITINLYDRMTDDKRFV